MNTDNPTSTATINGMPHGLPLSLRSEPRLVIHPPSPPDDRAAGPAHPARTNQRSVLKAVGARVADGALARDDFQRALQLEMRRSDRTRAPLSLVLYQVDDADRSPGAAAFRLLDALAANKRETDVLGFTGPGSLAVLFPATPAEGARHFIAKIAAQGFNEGITASPATYPNCLFDELAGTKDAAASAQRDSEPGNFHAPFAERRADSHTLDGRQPGYFLKRGLDLVGASVAIVLVSPLLLATALAIATTSPGPVIFKQKRLGKDGKPFVFYKFRSMHCGADDGIHRQYVASLIKGDAASAGAGSPPTAAGATGPSPDAGGATIYKLKADPRISRVGRIIRKTSIDELPQLFNVLRGEMSLVGPRPALPYEAENYQSWHLRRVWAIRPGITGLWQVEGRSRVPFDEMVRMDLRYIRHCSLALDLKILLKTVKVVLRCEGAV